jgi:hypothetical protein
MLALPIQVAPQEVNKRQRGEQLEPAASPAPETWLPASDSSQALTFHSLSLYPSLPESLYHPPYTLDFIEIYDSLCQYEARLNVCLSYSDIKDVQADNFMLFHRILDQPGRTFGLEDRIADLETNIKFKLLRYCNHVIQNAAHLADTILSFRYSPLLAVCAPDVSEVEAMLRVTDDVAFSLHFELEPFKQLYLRHIRPTLVSYWEEEPHSDEDSVLPIPTQALHHEHNEDTALSETPERELPPA